MVAKDSTLRLVANAYWEQLLLPFSIMANTQDFDSCYMGSIPIRVVYFSFYLFGCSLLCFCILHRTVLLSCTSLDFVQLKAVQDRLRGFGVYIHSHVKTNLSRSTPYQNTPNILLFLFLFLDSRYRRYLQIWCNGITRDC